MRIKPVFARCFGMPVRLPIAAQEATETSASIGAE